MRICIFFTFILKNIGYITLLFSSGKVDNNLADLLNSYSGNKYIDFEYECKNCKLIRRIKRKIDFDFPKI